MVNVIYEPLAYADHIQLLTSDDYNNMSFDKILNFLYQHEKVQEFINL